MARPIKRTLVAALPLLLLTSAVGVAGPSAEELYPIWWSPKLELDSLESIDDRLARPFWDPSVNPSGLPLYPEEYRQEDMREARNCVELFALRELGYYARPYHAFKLMLALESWCRAITALRTAKPAERSFVQGFRFDGASLDVIPPMALLGWGCWELCWQHAANHQRLSLAEVHPDIEITGVDDLLIELEMPNVQGDSLELVGRADFDGDGLEDLLVIHDTHAIGGTYGGTHDMLLTRDAPGAVMTVINAAQHLCPEYECTPSEFDPPALRKAD